MKRILLILLSLIVSIIPDAIAQAGQEVFVPLPVTIFEDDFRDDSIGSFPRHWWIMHRDSVKYKRHCIVRMVNGKKALVINTIGHWRTHPLFCNIGPKMPGTNYLPEDFTLEFDVQSGNATPMSLQFYATNATWILHINISANNRISYFITDGQVPPPYASFEMPVFNYKDWHHLALSYSDRKATCYIDGKKVFTTPALIRNPYKFLLDYGATMPDRKDSIAYTNFRIATDSSKETTDFNRLLKENTFTTYGILFDRNKAEIMHVSAGFVKRFAQWLNANQTVQIEIRGHTDSDGDSISNMQLSQARADAVKMRLVSLGVADSRLTTKGYGATDPIQPNTRPEFKQANRRVEFIRR